MGDPTSDDNTKLSAGIVAYRNKPYRGADMRVEFYHSPYEHMAGDAYSYWDDNPKKAVEMLQNHSPQLMFPLPGFEEGISVSASVEDTGFEVGDLFAIQELGVFKVPETQFNYDIKNQYWGQREHNTPWNGEIHYQQPPASSFPMGVPDIKHATYLQYFSDELQFKGVKAMNDAEIRWSYNHLYSYVIWRGKFELIDEV